ncbi:MAG TPA: hypothetical protein VGG40_04760 [Solirubrobacterales bacterium]
MLDTVPNLSLATAPSPASPRRSGNERSASDSYRRFAQTFGNLCTMFGNLCGPASSTADPRGDRQAGVGCSSALPPGPAARLAPIARVVVAESVIAATAE